MQPRAIKLLEDIRNAGAAVQRLTRGRSESDYLQDEGLRLAVERSFEIIGEAMRRLLEADATLAGRISRLRQIIDFRNVIAHGYDVVDDRRVWSVAHTDLPVLIAEVDALLKEQTKTR